jgi:hypothetical protein
MHGYLGRSENPPPPSLSLPPSLSSLFTHSLSLSLSLSPPSFPFPAMQESSTVGLTLSVCPSPLPTSPLPPFKHTLPDAEKKRLHLTSRSGIQGRVTQRQTSDINSCHVVTDCSFQLHPRGTHRASFAVLTMPVLLWGSRVWCPLTSLCGTSSELNAVLTR